MRRLQQTLAKIEEAMAVLLLVSMCVATFVNVAGRYLFNSPLQWAEEFSRYAFIWLVFVVAIVATTRKKHIVIDFLVSYLPKRAKGGCRVITDLVSLGLMAILVYYGWVMVRAATQPTATLGIPQSWVYMAVPACALLMFCHILIDLAAGWPSVDGGGSRS
jgi:TRAP-type C4-dicarboxylate transport system permease small subunit